MDNLAVVSHGHDRKALGVSIHHARKTDNKRPRRSGLVLLPHSLVLIFFKSMRCNSIVNPRVSLSFRPICCRTCRSSMSLILGHAWAVDPGVSRYSDQPE